MKKFKRSITALSVCFLTVLLVSCSKGNIFSWTHKAGGNTDTQALSSDAYTALRDKDYSKAMDYFLKILESDPDNSEAIYGYSAATLADAGLDIGSLVANLVKSNGTPAPSIDGLANSIAFAANDVASLSQSNIIPQSILDNLPKVKSAVEKILNEAYLLRIVKGNADGTIEPDNPDVNLNLAFCFLLRAAINLNEIVEIGTDYNVTLRNVDGHDVILIQAGKDIVNAFHRLLVVVNKLDLSSDAGIAKIKSDIQTLFNDLDAKLQNEGITINLDLNNDYI